MYFQNIEHPATTIDFSEIFWPFDMFENQDIIFKITKGNLGVYF